MPAALTKSALVSISALMKRSNSAGVITICSAASFFIPSLMPGSFSAFVISPCSRKIISGGVYFTSVTQNNDPDIYKRAYVGSDDITQYDRVLESLLKDRLTARRQLSEELNPTKAKEPKL